MSFDEHVIRRNPAMRSRPPAVSRASVPPRDQLAPSIRVAPPIPNHAKVRDIFAALLQEMKRRKGASFNDNESHA